jgi:FkbM family methyltransferase
MQVVLQREQQDTSASDTTAHTGFPSRVTRCRVARGRGSYSIKIPEHEIFRLNEIFNEQEYSLPENTTYRTPMTIVDVGANVGAFAIYGKLLGFCNVIHCFEPAPASVSLLRENLNSIPGIHIHPCGLSDHQGRAMLRINPHSTGQNSIKFGDDDSELVEIELRNAAHIFKDLDVDHIDILKIDTEGCELEILEALRDRYDDIDYIMVEYHSDKDRREIDALLESLVIYGSRAIVPNLGVVKYMNRRLISA